MQLKLFLGPPNRPTTSTLFGKCQILVPANEGWPRTILSLGHCQMQDGDHRRPMLCFYQILLFGMIKVMAVGHVFQNSTGQVPSSQRSFKLTANTFGSLGQWTGSLK